MAAIRAAVFIQRKHTDLWIVFAFCSPILSHMKVGGYNRTVDFSKLGGAVLIGACVILAVRTARWEARRGGTGSDRELEVEVDHAILLAKRVLGSLASRAESLLPSKDVPWYEPTDEDVVP